MLEQTQDTHKVNFSWIDYFRVRKLLIYTTLNQARTRFPLRYKKKYLNDVPKGGGTKFTKLDITSKAKKGKILVFANTYEGSTVRHELSEHAGLPVEEGGGQPPPE